MTDSPAPVHSPAKKSKPANAPGGVRLIPSALFFTAVEPTPSGLRAADIPAMVRGWVEEHSPLPVERTAWGYLVGRKGRKRTGILYYAAPADLVFNSAGAASDLRPIAVLPAFAACYGLDFRKPTWLFLAEKECVTALFFEAGENAPSRVLSRFHETSPTDLPKLFACRARLVEMVVPGAEAVVVEGLIRVAEAVPVGNRGVSIVFQQCREPDAGWTRWQKTALRRGKGLVAADVRDREKMAEFERRRRAGQRIAIVAAIFAGLMLLLGTFEFLHARRSREAEGLMARARAQEPEVQRLREIEALNQSVNRIFQREFVPFQWLMALNDDRPDPVSLASFTLDNSGTLVANGQAPEIRALNSFVETLRRNPKFQEVALANLNTDRDGVTFTLRLKTGDILAVAPARPPDEPAPLLAEEEEFGEEEEETP
jgi:hypothetical protein